MAHYKNQCQQIIEAILENGSVSALELEHAPYYITNPRGRISDLRAQGIQFKQQVVKHRVKAGGRVIIKDYYRYSLPKTKTNQQKVRELFA